MSISLTHPPGHRTVIRQGLIQSESRHGKLPPPSSLRRNQMPVQKLVRFTTIKVIGVDRHKPTPDDLSSR